MADKNIDGFIFADEADISIVEDEIARIKYISERMNMTNAQGVLAVYDKLISGGIFVTPIGYEYLRTLQNYLYNSPEIPDEMVKSIPVAISYSSALDIRNKERDERMEKSKRKFKKTFKNEYKASLIINLILVVLVIAMFVITLKADNPNMINYRTAIINEYSEWEVELTQRENAVREKEKQLGIDDN